jgi:hypothetical protein
MLEIRHPSFDKRLFSKMIEVLDSIYMMYKFQSKDIKYYVDFHSSNAEGYLYKVALVNSETKKGIVMYVYENQSLKYKGYIVLKLLREKNSQYQIKNKVKEYSDKIIFKQDREKQYINVAIFIKDYNDLYRIYTIFNDEIM